MPFSEWAQLSIALKDESHALGYGILGKVENTITNLNELAERRDKEYED